MASESSIQSPASRLAERLRETRRDLVLVVTGAGVSHASGIPTFRGDDPDAIWSRDITELGTYAYFAEDPAGSWRWYLHRFAAMGKARPNAAHRALAALERWQASQGGELLLVTQNIDTLHEAAGSQNLIKIHGSSDRVRCPRYGCRYGAPYGSLPVDQFDLVAFEIDPRPAYLPVCPECGTVLRQHVLWFDEYYGEHRDYQFERAVGAADHMALLLCIGTSFSVGITDLLTRAAWKRRVPVLSVDPGAGRESLPLPTIDLLSAPAEEILPESCDLLGVAVE